MGVHPGFAVIEAGLGHRSHFALRPTRDRGITFDPPVVHNRSLSSAIGMTVVD
jgi:hypothetical protein